MLSGGGVAVLFAVSLLALPQVVLASPVVVILYRLISSKRTMRTIVACVAGVIVGSISVDVDSTGNKQSHWCCHPCPQASARRD